MDAAGLFTSVEGQSLTGAARVFATAGVPVFPCVPGEKRPLTEHGFHDATADVRQVAAWWRRWPGANIGVPTGAASGLEVVDVDVKTAGSGSPGSTRHALRVSWTGGRHWCGRRRAGCTPTTRHTLTGRSRRGRPRPLMWISGVRAGT